MTKRGSYKVSDVRPSKDGSFRSMLCAMLLFLAICGIIILFTWLIKTANTKVEQKSSSQYGVKENTTTQETFVKTDQTKILPIERKTTPKTQEKELGFTTPSVNSVTDVTTAKKSNLSRASEDINEKSISSDKGETTTLKNLGKEEATTNTPKTQNNEQESTTPSLNSVTNVTTVKDSNLSRASENVNRSSSDENKTSTQKSLGKEETPTTVMTTTPSTQEKEQRSTTPSINSATNVTTAKESKRPSENINASSISTNKDETTTQKNLRKEEATTMVPTTIPKTQDTKQESTIPSVNSVTTVTIPKDGNLTRASENKNASSISTNKDETTTQKNLRKEEATTMVQTTMPKTQDTEQESTIPSINSVTYMTTPKDDNLSRASENINETSLFSNKDATATQKNLGKKEAITTIPTTTPKTQDKEQEFTTPSVHSVKNVITPKDDNLSRASENINETLISSNIHEPTTQKILGKEENSTTIPTTTPKTQDKEQESTTPSVNSVTNVRTAKEDNLKRASENINETSIFSNKDATATQKKIGKEEASTVIPTTTPETQDKKQEFTTPSVNNVTNVTTAKEDNLTRASENINETSISSNKDATATQKKLGKEEDSTVIPTTTPETQDKKQESTTPAVNSVINVTTAKEGNLTRASENINETSISLNKNEITIQKNLEKEEASTTVQTTIHAAPPAESDYSENYSYEDLSTLSPIDDNRCFTPVCKTFSSLMLAQINHEADKCESFYDFTCGGQQIENTEENIWININKKLETIHEKSSSKLKLFKNYYDICLEHHISSLDKARINAVKDILHSTVSSNITTENKDIEITNLLATLMLNDYAPLFDISVEISKETKLFQFQLSLGQENTILQNENYVLQTQQKCMLKMKRKIASLKNVDVNYEYSSYLSCKNDPKEYINNIMQSAKDLNLDVINNDAYFESNLTKFINNFKNLLTPQIERTNIITKKYELKSISELKVDYPLIKWDVLFSQLVNKNVNDNELVQVYSGIFLKIWFSQLESFSKQNLYNILYAMFANNLYRALALPSSTSISETEKMCLKQSSKLFKEISSSMYLDTINEMDLESHINEINNIFAVLKEKFHRTIEQSESSGLQNDSKEYVLKKLKNMALITNMAIWNNESIIDARMADVPANIQTYQTFTVELVKRYRKMIYKMWNQKADDPEHIWWYYQTVYSESFVPIYALNKIAISPVKLLEVPKNTPSYIRLAKLYYLLGKAIGHHFDYTGIKYDVVLDDDSENAYQNLKNCSSDIFLHKQSINFGGKTMEYEISNSLQSLSLNNRIAEDIALKLTYDLMNTNLLSENEIIWLSSTYGQDDLSFIAIAQEHCKKISVEEIIIQLFENEELPAPILLRTILPNLQKFRDVVRCREGSTMHNPVVCPAFQDLTE